MDVVKCDLAVMSVPGFVRGRLSCSYVPTAPRPVPSASLAWSRCLAARESTAFNLRLGIYVTGGGRCWESRQSAVSLLRVGRASWWASPSQCQGQFRVAPGAAALWLPKPSACMTWIFRFPTVSRWMTNERHDPRFAFSESQCRSEPESLKRKKDSCS